MRYNKKINLKTAYNFAKMESQILYLKSDLNLSIYLEKIDIGRFFSTFTLFVE